MSDRLLRNFRAIMFGLVWAFLLSALGVKMWSFLWFASLIPAIFIFYLIEGIAEGIIELWEEGEAHE